MLPALAGTPQAALRAVRSRLSSQSVGCAAMNSIFAWRVAVSIREMRIEELLPIEYLTRAPDTGVTCAASQEKMGYESSVEAGS